MTPRRPGAANAAIGRNVRTLRQAKGISQRFLGELASIPPTTVTRLESGLVNMTVDQLVALARALGCAPSRLLKGVR